MIGTLEQLYDYEQVEDAWIKILQTCGLTCCPEFSNVDRDASTIPYVEVTMNNIVPTGHLYPYKGTEQLPDWWEANLISRVVTFRGVNSDRHRLMVGRIRIEIQRYQQTFLESILPYHCVKFFRETALTRGVDDLKDWSEVHGKIVFHIRDNAWPD